MALKLLQPGSITPLGQFDFLDGDLASVTGGEVGELTQLTNDGSDLSAADATDGYAELTDVRVAMQLLDSGTPAPPFFLLDDGTSAGNPDVPGYPTLFGSVIGANVGQATQNAGAVVIGPHSALASGKVTAWYNPGLFGTDSHGLSVGELGTPPSAGAELFAQGGTAQLGTSSNGERVAYFVDLLDDESLVSTSFGNTTPIMAFLKGGN